MSAGPGLVLSRALPRDLGSRGNGHRAQHSGPPLVTLWLSGWKCKALGSVGSCPTRVTGGGRRVPGSMDHGQRRAYLSTGEKRECREFPMEADCPGPTALLRPRPGIVGSSAGQVCALAVLPGPGCARPQLPIPIWRWATAVSCFSSLGP